MPEFPYRNLPWIAPLAPVANVTVRWGGRYDDLEMILDTGADFTTIPQRVANRMRLPRLRKRSVRDFNGQTMKKQVYAVDLELCGHIFPAIQVVAVDSAEAVIGRDILNLIAVLDGPRRVYFVPDPPTQGPTSPSRPGLLSPASSAPTV